MNFIEEAQKILQVREKQYVKDDDKFAIFERAASYWSVLFDKKVTESDVIKAMILFKMARCDKGNLHEDNYVDMIGYSHLLGEIDVKKP